MDLAPVRHNMLQGKNTVKSSGKNPAAPTPASKKEQGTVHLDGAEIQDYVTLAM